MNKIVDILSKVGSITTASVYENHDVKTRVNEKVAEITQNKVPTFLESLVNDVTSGVVTEFALADAVGGKINPAKHVYSDWTSYAYDVIGADGSLIEIKRLPTAYGEKYFRFNMKNFRENPPKATYLDTFVKNSERLDYLVLVELSVDGFVKPRYCIDAKSFTRYIGKADYDYVPTHWYNLPKAIKDKKCYDLTN